FKRIANPVWITYFLKLNYHKIHFLSLVLETNVTDHYSTILQYTCNNLSPEQFSDNSNSLKKFINYTTLNNKLRIENWLDVYKEEDIEKATQNFVNKLKSNIEECTKKLLTINVLKTFYVPFTSYRSNLPEFNTLEISQNTLISGKESIKYLGTVIDCHLRWDLHMQYLVKKLRSLIPKFKYFKNICDIQQLNIMYYALIQSHLSYGIIAWGGVNSNYLKQLEVTQKWIIKIMYKKIILTHPMIYMLYARSLLLKQYAEIHKKNNINSITRYNTRNKDAIKTPKTFKTIGQRCFNFLSPTLYNTAGVLNKDTL
ncbi:hypothetical protein NQ317_016730, partial [Molorchus minor]